jgi:integrase
MPKVPTQLTDTKLSKAKPKEKSYTLPDGKGLHLLIKPNGSKIWEFVFISPITKKRRKKSLGSYPNVTLEKAREQRSNNHVLLQDKKDPVEEERKKEQEEKASDKGLFENVMNEWFKRQKNQLTEVTYKKKYQVFVSSVLPYFRDKQIKDITKLELLHVLEEKEKTAKETASRLFNYLSNLWGYAVLKDYCEYNYLANINKNDVLVEKRVVTNYSKITDEETFKELVNKTYKYKGSVSIKNALRLVLHIPLRAYNLCNLKWEYIDFKEKVLTIPRELMKVKNPNLPPFKVPLTDEVINILENQKEYSSLYAPLKEFVFIGTNNVKPINTESPNQALRRMGFAAEKQQTLHSFRGTFRTILEEKQEEHNISEKIMESILDHHTDTKVVKAYKNKVSYLEQQKPLMKYWSEFIMSLKN